MSKLWENIFSRFGGKETEGIDTALSHVPVFQDLDKRELSIVKSILYRRDYKRSEVIFNKDDVGLGMYIIVQGAVSIVDSPGSHELAELKERDFFGELALLDDAPRSASAIAATPTQLLCFFKPELLDLIERYPRIGNKILFRLAWTIGERLKSTNRSLCEMICLSRRDIAPGQ